MALEYTENPRGCLHRKFAKKLWPYLRLNSPTTFSPVGEPNFVFQDIEALTKMRKNTEPPNRYVRTGGYVHISESMVFLKSNVSDQNVKVILDYADTYPQPGTLIEVFGKIYFNEMPVPYILGYFHRSLRGSYQDYKELCTRINKLLLFKS